MAISKKEWPLRSQDFCAAIGKLLDIPMDNVSSLVITAEIGRPVVLVITQLGDARLLEYNWLELSKESTPPPTQTQGIRGSISHGAE